MTARGPDWACCPVEVWLDYLEEAGEDVGAARVCLLPCTDGHDYDHGHVSGSDHGRSHDHGHGHGHGYGYDYGYGYGRDRGEPVDAA